MKLIISSYKTNGDSIGLFNITDKKYEKLSKADILAPSFIVNGGDYIYTYEKSDVVSLYSYKQENEKLVKYDQIVIPGTSATHITYSKKNNLLIGCCYSDGTFFSVGVKDGKFTKIYSYLKQIEDDRLSRCHCVLLNKSEDVLAVVNIALDAVYLYDIVRGELIYKDIIEFKQGVGPRHAIYNQDNTLMYIMTEYSNEVIVVDMLSKKVIQEISTIPNYKDTSYGATLIFSKDSKYLFASNRGEDSIARFKVLDSGKLEYINSFSCGGKHPRHMVLSKDGNIIISCNKDSNNVALIDINKEDVVLDIPFENVSGVDTL